MVVNNLIFANHSDSEASKQEMKRLEELRRLNILDTAADPALDAITTLVARLFDVPIVLIDFVDAERVWAKSCHGTDVSEYKIHPGLCSSAILEDQPYIIHNAKTDPRTANHPLVKQEGVSFYAGVQLKTKNQLNIGMLCMIDFKPHDIAVNELETLQDLATIAMKIVESGVTETRFSEIQEIENKFKLSELQNQLILNSTAEGIHVIDLNGVIIVENLSATQLLGRVEGDLLGKHAHTTMHHHHADHTEYDVSDCPIYKTLKDGLPRTVANEVFWRKDGTCFPVEYSTTPLKDLNGKLCGTTVVFRDITARRANEAKIQQLAYYDPLTGLPNRTLFIDRLEQEIKKAHRNNSHLSLMFIDMDRFKEINDTLGHDIGDQLLIEASHRLKACVRETDTVARLGGDEFTIISAGFSELTAEKRIVENILAALSHPFLLNNETVYLSASIGITIYPNDGLTTEDLLKNADQSMYAAKKAGRNRYHYFTSSMQELAKSRLRMVTDLHHGINHQEFFLVYQPIVDLITGEAIKAEALIRWQHPTKGLISPLEFIPVAEDIGLILEIGQWVFEEAARQVKHLQQLGIHDFQISVNTSPAQFHNSDDLNRHWVQHLNSMGLSAENICIEITEGLLLDASKNITQILKAFRNSGMQLSLDDFGTGYSSLSYLSKYAIDYIKIDRSFVTNLAKDTSDFALCEAIIAMAHKLDIKVIAEGIETELQKNLLLQAGCDFGQGFYFSKPIASADFETYLVNKCSATLQ